MTPSLRKARISRINSAFGRAAFRSESVVLIVVLLLAVHFAAGCHTYPYLIYQIQPSSDQTVVAGEKGDKKNQVYRYYSFLNATSLRVRGEREGVLTDFLFLRPDDMYNLARDMGQIRNLNVPRLPDLLAIRVHIRNYRTRPLRVDTYRFRIRDTDNNVTYRIIEPEEYYRERYSSGIYLFDYYWAFEPKDSYRFHHPIPDWYFELHKTDTSSPAEKKLRRRKKLAYIQRRHQESLSVPPGRELKGYLLFPQLPAGNAYRLEYAPGKDDSPQTPETKIFEMIPVPFRIKLVKTFREPQDGPDRVNRTAATVEERSDESFRSLAERDEAAISRDLRTLYEMHRQLRKHAKLRDEQKEKKRSGEPIRGETDR